jgi:hypothetical protein
MILESEENYTTRDSVIYDILVMPAKLYYKEFDWLDMQEKKRDIIQAMNSLEGSYT